MAVDAVVVVVVTLLSGSDVLTVAATAATDMEGGAFGRVGLGLFGCLTCGRRMGWKANASGFCQHCAYVMTIRVIC